MSKNPKIKLTKTGIMQPVQITTTWVIFTQWIDELYSKHSQDHGLVFSESLTVLNSNGYLQFPTVLVEVIK